MSAERVILRKLEPDDLPLLYAWENDSSAWLDGNRHNPLSEADLRDYIMRTTGDIYQDGQLRLMISVGVDEEEKASRQVSVETPVGCVDLCDVDIRNRKAAVAIYISRAYRRKGIAQEAIVQLKAYAANILCFRMLYAMIREDNSASLTAFRNAGFQIVASLPQWVNEGNIFVLQTLL